MSITKNILVLVPGTSASTLSSSDDSRYWPDTVFASELADDDDPNSLTFKATLKVMETGNLRPDKVLVSSLGKPTAYQGFVDYFTNTDNFAEGSDAYTDYYPQYSESNGESTVNGLNDSNGKSVQDLADNALIAFAYDWRQDNVKNATSLQNMLQFIDSKVSGDYNVYLVGHSMGGLVSRGYLEIVGKNDDWYGNIQSLITVATPHYGAPLALSAISDQLPELQGQVVTNFAEKLVDYKGLPSSYQLLPSDLEHPFIDCNGTSYSIYSDSPDGLRDILLNSEYQNANQETPDNASPDNLEANTTFYNQLDPSNLKNKYYCVFGINSGETVTGFTYWNPAGSIASGIQKGGILSPVGTASGGDAVVPQDSALFSGVVASDHTYQAMTTDPDAKNGDPWTQDEPNHINLIGRTDVLEYIKNQIQ